MEIIDAQIHLWSKGETLAPHRAEPYSMEQALADMDAAGVDGAVIHPPSWDPESGALAEAAARARPNRFAILGQFPLDRPESRDLIAGWKQRPGMLGLRFTFLKPHQATWPTDGTMDWLWPAAERAQIPVALLCSGFLPLVGKIAERHPGLKLIVDHLGVVRLTTGDAAYATVPELVKLARHNNIAMKATGAPRTAADAYPYRSVHDHIHRLFDAFGPERFFWGTDITRMPCTWRQCITMFTEELPWLGQRDMELVMGKALCNWLGWKRSA
jgi:predicted TIM-barrel fold metal-dependent hydrolase